MQLLYGGVPIADAGWSLVGMESRLLRNRAGVGYGLLRTVSVPKLGLRVAGQADADTKAGVIEAALRAQGVDLVYRNDDASSSFKSVTSSGTLSGVRCVRWAWSTDPGAQHATYLGYSAEFEWEERFPGVSFLLTDYKEQVTVTGGVPLTVVIECVNTSPVSQVTVPQQKYTVTQQGFAVGLTGYPTPPALLYTNPKQRAVSKTSADRVGESYQNYRVDWSYAWEFASAPAGAVPYQWS